VREELFSFLVIKGIVLWTLFEMNEELLLTHDTTSSAGGSDAIGDGGTPAAVDAYSHPGANGDNSLVLWLVWFQLNGWLAALGAMGRLRLAAVSDLDPQDTAGFCCYPLNSCTALPCHALGCFDPGGGGGGGDGYCVFMSRAAGHTWPCPLSFIPSSSGIAPARAYIHSRVVAHMRTGTCMYAPAR